MLSVRGSQLVDQNGQKVILRGISTHGLHWFPQYYNREAFRTLRDQWSVNVIRLAMYIEEGGFAQDGGFGGKSYQKMIEGIDACLDLGLYCIVDWHVSNADQTPRRHWGEARDFFRKITERYGDNGKILYEICNEPNNTGNNYQAEIADYADDMIRTIRDKAPNAVVIIGSGYWSTRAVEAWKWDADNRGGRKNVMYTLHHYCSNDFDQWTPQIELAVSQGCPIMATECGPSDPEEHDWGKAEEFKRIIKFYERLGIGWQVWSLADKVEPTSLLKPGAPGNGGWTDEQLTAAGQLVRSLITGLQQRVVDPGVQPKPEPTPMPTPSPAPTPPPAAEPDTKRLTGIKVKISYDDHDRIADVELDVEYG